MDFYPVMLDLSNKNILMIGAGTVAQRKMKALMNKGCCLTIISKEVFFPENSNKELMENELSTSFKNLEIIDEPFSKDEHHQYIVDADLIFICSDNILVNEEISKYASEMNKFFLRCDDGKKSTFINPISRTIQGITISISTHGQSPAVSKVIMEKMANVLNEIDSDALLKLIEEREQIKRTEINPLKRHQLLMQSIKNNKLFDKEGERHEDCSGD